MVEGAASGPMPYSLNYPRLKEEYAADDSLTALALSKINIEVESRLNLIKDSKAKP